MSQTHGRSIDLLVSGGPRAMDLSNNAVHGLIMCWIWKIHSRQLTQTLDNIDYLSFMIFLYCAEHNR